MAEAYAFKTLQLRIPLHNIEPSYTCRYPLGRVVDGYLIEAHGLLNGVDLDSVLQLFLLLQTSEEAGQHTFEIYLDAADLGRRLEPRHSACRSREIIEVGAITKQ